MIEEYKRLKLIIAVIQECGGTVFGRKKLQKLIYLLQEMGLNAGFKYDYDFYNYGVFSYTLGHDMVLAEQLDLISEEMKELENSIYPYYEISLKNIKKEYLESNDLKFPEESKSLFDKKAAFLEVLSTIVYLDKVGYKGSELTKTLRELKGHLHGEFDKAYQFAKELFNIVV